jgi:hypothetical protein
MWIVEGNQRVWILKMNGITQKGNQILYGFKVPSIET